MVLPLIDIVQYSARKIAPKIIPLIAAGSISITAATAAGTIYLSAGCETGNEGAAECNKNSDCKPGEKCNRYGECVASSSNAPEQINKTYQAFVQALSSNNLEQALTYVHPARYDGFKSGLSGKNLPDLASQLSTTSPTNCQGQMAVECSITINGEDFPIQFQTYKDGYKIRNL
ncbi:MAG: hypothetical protein AB1668_02400 [Nanoarchaeota archaeon]